MKAIYYANVIPIANGVYEMQEIHAADYGLGWDGDVSGYLSEMLDGPEIISSTCNDVIRGMPSGRNMHYLTYEGQLIQVVWTSEVDDISAFDDTLEKPALMEQLISELKEKENERMRQSNTKGGMFWLRLPQ